MTQIQLFLLLCLTGAAAVVDARTQRIPNWLVGVGLAAAVVVRIALALAALESQSHRAVAGAALDALGGVLLGLIGCALLPLILYRAGAIGGGDVKLLAVAGALVALGPGLELTRAAIFVAVLFGFIKLSLTGRLMASLRTMGSLLRRLGGARRPAPIESSLTALPFGPHVFVAACYLALSSSPAANATSSSSGDPGASAAPELRN
jgi:prepilin peptidase CpaA